MLVDLDIYIGLESAEVKEGAGEINLGDREADNSLVVAGEEELAGGGIGEDRFVSVATLKHNDRLDVGGSLGGYSTLVSELSLQFSPGRLLV